MNASIVPVLTVLINKSVYGSKIQQKAVKFLKVICCLNNIYYASWINFMTTQDWVIKFCTNNEIMTRRFYLVIFIKIL